MQTFIDAVTGQYWQFEDNDNVGIVDGRFEAYDADGNWVMSVPVTLVPGELPPPAEPLPPTLEEVQAQRLAAYRQESDPLKIEAEYDAQVGYDLDYTAWLAKVEEIKARYPLPEASDG